MRLLQISVLALGLASSCSFAHEAPSKDSPDQKRDQSVDDFYATSWTETATRGASVVVIIHPHAQTHPHYETEAGRDDVARASTQAPEPCSVSTASTVSVTPQSSDTPAELASSSPAPTPRPTLVSPPLPIPLSTAAISPPRITMTVLGSPFGSPAEMSPMETFGSIPALPQKTGKPTKPIDSSQVQVCTGGSYVACVASYSCSKEPTEVMACYCRNNIREGCNNACGGHQKLQPEECPILPVGERPPGLPGPGAGPFRLLRRLGLGRRDVPVRERTGWWMAVVNVFVDWRVGVAE